MPEILICVDYNCTELIKVIADNDENLQLHKAHHTINLRYIQQLITQADHPIQLFLKRDNQQDLTKMMEKSANLLIQLVTQNILTLLAELNEKILKGYEYAQKIKSTYNYIQQNNLERLLENQDIVISVFSDEKVSEDKIQAYEQNLETILNTFNNKEQQMENVFQSKVHSPMKIVIGAKAIDLNFNSPLLTNSKKSKQQTSSFLTNKVFFKNEKMDEKEVILQLQNLLYVDVIEIDLGGLFQKKEFSKSNQLFKQICQYQMLESLTLCLMQSNLSDISQLSLGLSQLNLMRRLNLNFSNTKIKDISHLAISIGKLEALVKLQLNFQDSPVQNAEEFQKSFLSLKHLEEFTINLCGTNVPSQLCCFFGSVSGFQSKLSKVYTK